MISKDNLFRGLYASAGFIGTLASEYYNGPGKEFTKGYLHDISLPIFGLFLADLTLKNPMREVIPTWAKASFLLAGCSAMEFAQGLGWYRGTFDPWDFLAYATGAAIATGLDHLTFGRKKGKIKLDALE